MFGVRVVYDERHLVRAECAFDLQSIDHFRARPAFRRPEDDHRPARSRGVVLVPGIFLDVLNISNGRIQRGSHEHVHLLRVVAFHKKRCPATARQKLLQLLMVDAREDGRIADLVAVEMKNRQHGTIGDGIEKLVGVPRGRKRRRFRFAIANDAGDNQIGVVEHGPERMTERVSQFAAFVNGARRGGGNVAGNAAGKRELLEQQFHTGFVLRDIGVDVAPGAFQIDIAHDRSPAVAGSRDVKHVQIVFLDDPVQMHIDEILAGHGTPMPYDQRLHMRQLQRFAKKRVVVEVDLSHRQIVGGAPIGIHLEQQARFERIGCHGL